MQIVKILLGIAIVDTVGICITIIYWFIWGCKIKNKKRVLDFLLPKQSIIFYTILFCSVIYILTIFYFIPESKTIWESGMTTGLKVEIVSLPIKVMQVAPIICLSFLAIPTTLIRCLKSSIKKEKKQKG
jgi:lysylphosphatidylglycerol synthetase-like protein (DUF2156 family)